MIDQTESDHPIIFIDWESGSRVTRTFDLLELRRNLQDMFKKENSEKQKKKQKKLASNFEMENTRNANELSNAKFKIKFEWPEASAISLNPKIEIRPPPSSNHKL